MTTYHVTIFGLHLTIHPVAFSLPIKGGWDIYWYGIIIATGFLLAVLYGALNAKRFNLNFDKVIDAAIVTTPVAVLGARTYYVIFDGEKLGGIKGFFGLGTNSGFSGLAIYGGVIVAAICGTAMCLLLKINIPDALDLTAIGFLIGQGIGRWGNFMNQEAFGSFTGSSFWGMTSESTVRQLGKGLVHPCFLYESIWCLGGFVLLHFLSKKRHFSGEIALYYCVWYGFGRALVEPMRTDSLMLGGSKVSFLLSILICITAAVLIVLFNKKSRENKESLAYAEVFDENSDGEETPADIKEDENE